MSDLTRRQTITTGAAALAASTVPAVAIAGTGHPDAALLTLWEDYKVARAAERAAWKAEEAANAAAMADAPISHPQATIISRSHCVTRDEAVRQVRCLPWPQHMRDALLAEFDAWASRYKAARLAHDCDALQDAQTAASAHEWEFISAILRTPARTADGVLVKVMLLGDYSKLPEAAEAEDLDGEVYAAIRDDLRAMGGADV